MKEEKKIKTLSNFYTKNSQYYKTFTNNKAEIKNLNEVLNTILTKYHDENCQNIKILHVSEVDDKNLAQHFEKNSNLKAVTVSYSNFIIYGDKAHNTTIQHELTHDMSQKVMKDSMIEFLNGLKDNDIVKNYNSVGNDILQRIEKFKNKLQQETYPFREEKDELQTVLTELSDNFEYFETGKQILHQFLSLTDKGLDALYRYNKDLFADCYDNKEQMKKCGNFLDINLHSGYESLALIQEIVPRLVEDVITDGARYNFINQINARYSKQQDNLEVSFKQRDLETLLMMLQIVESYQDILSYFFFDKYIEALKNNIEVISTVIKKREEAFGRLSIVPCLWA